MIECILYFLKSELSNILICNNYPLKYAAGVFFLKSKIHFQLQGIKVSSKTYLLQNGLDTYVVINIF